MKTCKACMKKIDEKAKKCPYCQTDQRGWFRRHPILTVLLVLITSPFWIAILVGTFQGFSGSASSTNTNTAPSSKKQTYLNATVNFTGTQFIINNLDKYDCENARLQVNGGDYSLNGYNLEAGHQYTVGAGQFTKGDGTRLNPFTTKPQNFNIECRGSNELSSAYWYGEFK